MTPRTRTNGLPPPTPSEAAFERVLAALGTTPASDPPTSGEGPARAFLDDLYARADEFNSRDPYATIGDAERFNTKIVGVTFEGRQDVVAGLAPEMQLDVVRDRANPADDNAVAIHLGAIRLGYLRKEIAKRIAPHLDAGMRYRAEVKHVTGGGTRSTGVNIVVWRERERTSASAVARGRAADVLSALIGERPLRDAQRAVLERVDAGRNTLAVLGTGRGKSLCFQYPAAVRALETEAKTVVLYPLRALANDQFDALQRRLGPLGLRIFRANGAIDAAERAALLEALDHGTWDIVCATPEFLQFHVDRFAHDRSRPSLLVVDEAHHLVESTHRPAYGKLAPSLAALGRPQVLALTATAGDAVFAGIRNALGIEAWVIDPNVRENLHVVDARGVTNKLDYIARNVDGEGKAIVYCNSRSEATKQAEKLRARLGDVVAFYHAGVGTPERAQVEALFRAGEIRVVVATSAFGEGIDLPDVRDVFLYHLNFDLTEFNQQAGRSGRDGADARIHLLFGENDRALNDYIIERAAPRLDTLRSIYAGLKRIGTGKLRHTYVDLAGILDLGGRVNDRTVSTAVRIFAESGLAELGEDDEGKYLQLLPVDGKVDLTRNERFAEGEAERASFDAFSRLALASPPELLEATINRPIYPSNVPLVR